MLRAIRGAALWECGCTSLEGAARGAADGSGSKAIGVAGTLVCHHTLELWHVVKRVKEQVLVIGQHKHNVRLTGANRDWVHTTA